MRKVMITDIVNKKGKEKITSLTAYDYFTAKYLDEAGIDFLLVGDSINMVLYGFDTTLSVTMDMMCAHVNAVSRGAENCLVVADMPFMSYQADDNEAVKNAGRLILAGAGAVKLEGGQEFEETIRKIVRAGIPVLGHIGMQPQSIHVTGGYRTMGKSETSEIHLIESAKALENAGCFAIVLEKVAPDCAARITKTISIPTIGIGAGVHCDGQILVTNDILGLYDEFKPAFVRQYANLKETIINSTKKYIEDIKSGDFPSENEK